MVQIITVPIGKTEKRPLHNVVFKHANDGSTVLEISMADLARDQDRRKEDIRYLNDGLSADMILVGEILQGGNPPYIDNQLMVEAFSRKKKKGGKKLLIIWQLKRER